MRLSLAGAPGRASPERGAQGQGGDGAHAGARGHAGVFLQERHVLGAGEAGQGDAHRAAGRASRHHGVC